MGGADSAPPPRPAQYVFSRHVEEAMERLKKAS
jgi:hypothetical protein